LVTLSLETLDNFTNETTLDACREQRWKSVSGKSRVERFGATTLLNKMITVRLNHDVGTLHFVWM
jgi:hypothetical protein